MKKYIFIIAWSVLCISLCGCKKHKTQPKVPAPSWSVDNTGKYPASMTAVLQVPVNLQPYVQKGDELGAFIGNDCRGIGQLVTVGSSKVFFVLIHGTASEQGAISFKYYNAWKSYLYQDNNVVNFTMDGNYGTADAPEILYLEPVK